jgi:hypothetical protein
MRLAIALELGQRALDLRYSAAFDRLRLVGLSG